MSYLNKKAYTKNSECSVIYNDMRGVDFSEDGSNISRNRFAYLENMYRDYDGDGAGVIESIPGYRKICDLGTHINGLHTYKNSAGHDIIAVHAKNELHEFHLFDIDTFVGTIKTGGLADNESDSFSSEDSLYVLDGKKIFKISSEFRGEINDDNGGIYIPTTYVNGKEYEQRNLLTRFFFEKFNIGSCDSSTYGSHALKYAITDEEKLECEVVGITDDSVSIHIPSRVMLGDKYYYVKSIAKHAFEENKNIKYCYIANGIATINSFAFQKCLNLKKIVISDSVTNIGNSVFYGCESLVDLHLGSALKTLGTDLITDCKSLERITYSGDATLFSTIENNSVISETEIVYDTVINEITVGIDIHEPCLSVISVTIDGVEIPFEKVVIDGLCKTVKLTFNDKNLYNGKTAVIKGRLSSDREDYKSSQQSFITSAFKGGNISDIILHCKVSETFDGRVFLTGNSDYPGFTFYSSFDITGKNNPLYFGEMNYFKDGVRNFNNIALLAAGDSLAVFKERDDGGGSIYYHVPLDTDINLIPRIYPVSYVHSGFCAKGKAISFFDDPVFVSEKGISALTKKNINLERSIATRSSNVNYKLLTEDAKSIKLAVWRGYLVVLAKDKIYLADSRSLFTSDIGELEYEWYYLSGIGSYKNDKYVYKYSSVAHEGFNVHPKTDEIVSSVIYSTYENGELICYVIESGDRYEVYSTEEKSGGDFYHATHIISVDDKLIFATVGGDVLVFNNDKRGVAPPYIRNSENFNKEEYETAYARQIHPYYYSFAGHATRYAVQTKKDNCTIPHLTKNTVKESLSVKCRAISSGKIICEVGTDNLGYTEVCEFPNRELFFSDIDFSNLSLSTNNIYTVPIHEKSKNWIEKQITLYSEDYASPFGIYLIAYRFNVKGKIKKHR